MWAQTSKSHCRHSQDEVRRFEAYAELAGWSGVLEVAAQQTEPTSMAGAEPEAIRLGRMVHAVLLPKTEGKTLHMVHITPRGVGAGLEVVSGGVRRGCKHYTSNTAKSYVK